MSQWGFYFNQNRCIGCKACVMGCKNWNKRFRGDNAFHIDSVEAVNANSDYTPKVDSMQSSIPFMDETGALNTDELGKYCMKENWRTVTEHDKGSITVDSDTNTYVSTFDRSYLSAACNHCSDPACVKACPMGVYHKDLETGIVLYNNASCISCGRCNSACPWENPQYYSKDYATYPQNDPERPRMTKCTGCFDRISEGLKPACVAACRARALDFGPMSELESKYNGDFNHYADGFEPGVTQPNIIFRAKKNIIA